MIRDFVEDDLNEISRLVARQTYLLVDGFAELCTRDRSSRHVSPLLAAAHRNVTKEIRQYQRDGSQPLCLRRVGKPNADLGHAKGGAYLRLPPRETRTPT